MTIAWEAAGGTDVGRVRAGNEDALHLDAERGIFLVADGMGGHAAGEVASALAASTVAALLAEALDAGADDGALPEVLREACMRAHAQILRRCQDDPSTRGMGTTLTACVFRPAGRCLGAHVGDSRLYRLRAGRLAQITHDHTWVQREVDAGRLAPEAAEHHPFSHILTRVLTDDAPPEIDLISRSVAPGDLFLLATDGLYNMLEDDEIARILRLDLPLLERTEALIGTANAAGGADNISVVLVRALPG